MQQKTPNYFYCNHGHWFGEQVSLHQVAENVGTPCYVYSRQGIEDAYARLDQALKPLPHQICYAVKANSNLAILQLLGRRGAGCDIVSIGELERALYAHIPPEKIVFSGVGKTTTELTAALNANIGCFNIESPSELNRLNAIACTLGKKARIALRINPNVVADNHPYIATGHQDCKFGIDIGDALTLYQEAQRCHGLQICGIAFHLGSQITSLNPFIKALDKMLALVLALKEQGIALQHINVGGGLGINYHDEHPPSLEEYGQLLTQELKDTGLMVYCEPGRALVGENGILLTKVEYIKKHARLPKFFAIVDAGMNDLLRPALYQAWHNIIPIYPHLAEQTAREYDIVGPICESADVFATSRQLALAENSILMISNAGSYGFSMSSNYNSRPRAAEVLIDKDRYHIIRAREEIKELFSQEVLW